MTNSKISAICYKEKMYIFANDLHSVKCVDSFSCIFSSTCALVLKGIQKICYKTLFSVFCISASPKQMKIIQYHAT